MFNGKYLGTQSHIDVFSLSIAKTISSGQGGFVVTNNKNLYKKLIKLKNNGLIDIKNIFEWGNIGLNFKFNDILSTIALSELNKFSYYKKKLINLYKFYNDNLKNHSQVQLIKVNISKGEIPQYIEILTKKRQSFLTFDKKKKLMYEFFTVCQKAKCLNQKSNLLKILIDLRSKDYICHQDQIKKKIYLKSLKL